MPSKRKVREQAHQVVVKPNERLLRDVGLDRTDVIGPIREFWLGWDRRQAIWRL